MIVIKKSETMESVEIKDVIVFQRVDRGAVNVTWLIIVLPLGLYCKGLILGKS